MLIVGNDPLHFIGYTLPGVFYRSRRDKSTHSIPFYPFSSGQSGSALLVSSNPTNLVLTSAFGISFLSYSAWLALPTVASVIILYPILRHWSFRNERFIPRKLSSTASRHPRRSKRRIRRDLRRFTVHNPPSSYLSDYLPEGDLKVLKGYGRSLHLRL